MKKEADQARFKGTQTGPDTIRKLYRVFNAKLFISFLLFLEND